MDVEPRAEVSIGGERLASVDALPAALDAAFKAGGPTLFELNVTVEPPWELK